MQLLNSKFKLKSVQEIKLKLLMISLATFNKQEKILLIIS